jgi:hypothetical protein
LNRATGKLGRHDFRFGVLTLPFDAIFASVAVSIFNAFDTLLTGSFYANLPAAAVLVFKAFDTICPSAEWIRLTGLTFTAGRLDGAARKHRRREAQEKKHTGFEVWRHLETSVWRFSFWHGPY